jgi:hypothetical protein
VSRTGRWHGTALLRARLEAREEGGRDARVYCYTTTSGKEQGSRPNGMGIVPSHAHCSLSLSMGGHWAGGDGGGDSAGGGAHVLLLLT